jgi:osmotically-inducible protein OsmY
MKNRIIKTLFMGVAAIFLSGCVAASQYETPQEFMEGSMITTGIKARLARTAGLESLSLSVQTLEGEVLLSGFVQNEEQKRSAEEVARNTEGVTKVINNIVVQ